MATKEEFQNWLTSLDNTPPVRWEAESDGAASIVFGSTFAATLSVTPVMDGSSRVGWFVETDVECDEVETWLNDVNEVLMEQPKLTFAQCLSELVKRLPRCFQGASTSNQSCEEDDDEPAFEDDDDDDVSHMVVEETAAEREARRKKFAEEQEEAQRAEAIQNTLSTAGSTLSKQAQQVLMREMKALLMLKGDGASKAVEIEMVQDRLDHWRATMLADSFPECDLKADLYRYASTHRVGAAVIMDLMFPSDFPLQPPFIRVVRPRFMMHSGHVTIGGSICMEALTPSGWMPTLALENIFVEIRSQMVEGGGRLDVANSNEYTQAEAREAFNRVAARYGWLKPK